MGLLTLSLVLGVLFVYSSAEFTLGNREKRILYGDRIDIGEAPFMASLMDNGFDEYVCGGTLIDSQWILTAAHCLKDQRDPNAWRVSLGVTGQIQFRDGLKVSHIVIHESYNGNDPMHRNDIALMRLSNAVNLNQNIKLANLIKGGEKLTQHCRVYGRASDGILRTASRELLSSKQCRSFDRYFNSATEMCTYSMLHYGQPGDSGGPLMCKVKTVGNTFARRLVGVRSSGNGAKGKPDIYTRASGFLTWIDQKMNAIYN